ncbi:MAG: peptidylprolyl isomerase [Halobacteriales archaeon]|nr:peptidylprolyl isomerase [Halobacteriales archaeon]
MRCAALVPIALLLAGCAQSPAPAPAAPSGPVQAEALRLDLDLGTITVLLYPQAAPQTVALMKQLAAERYFDGREFNRVVPGHVIQVVDKAGGATDDRRTVPLEAPPAWHFSAGAAGIARGQDPNSGGPEFFLMDFGTSHLDGNYTVWGQAFEGLDVIHKAARVPAVAFSDISNPLPPEVPLSPQSVAPSDRMAIQAPTIRTARLVQVTLTAEQAAKLPMQVAQNVRSGDSRHSLEWPHDLRAGVSSNLTWYIRPYNGTSPPGPGDVQIQVDGATLDVQGEAFPGIYHWRWSPSRTGAFDATLLRNGTAMATLRVTV